MDDPVSTQLRQLAEPLVTLSVDHLSAATRALIEEERLSVNVYPTRFGGFVYVGVPRYDTPLEPDLAELFDAAQRAGVAWLKFDVHGAVIDGLPRYVEPGAPS